MTLISGIIWPGPDSQKNIHDRVPSIKVCRLKQTCCGGWRGGHNGPKLLILAPQDIPNIPGHQLGFGCQCVKAYNNENPVTNQKIL